MEDTLAKELQDALNKATTDNAELRQQLDDALTANDALAKEVEKLSASASKAASAIEKTTEVINLSEHSFEHEGKKYGFRYPKLTRKGQKITPVEVKASPELQKELVGSGSSMIYEK